MKPTVKVSSGRLGIRGWFYSVIGTMVVLVIACSVVGVVVFERASQASNNLIASLGPALGLLPGLSDWPVAELPIEPGGELLFYTDGLYENRDEGGKLWGIERMVSSAEELAGLPDHQFIDALIAATRDRTGRGDCDDVAVLHLRVHEDALEVLRTEAGEP